MKDKSFNDTISPTFIALNVMAIHHCLSAWRRSKFRVPLEFGPGGGAQCKCNTRNIYHMDNHACNNEACCLDADFHSSLPEAEARKRDNIRSMIRQTIHPNATDPALGQPPNDMGSFDEDFLDYVLEELIEQPDNSFNHLSSCVAATEACMRFSAVLPMGGSGIAGRSQPIPCSNSNSNDITNITSVVNAGLDNGSMIVEGAMWLWVWKWCEWSDLEFPWSAILF